MSPAGAPGSGSARSGRKERAVLALLEHPTIEKAAAAVGISDVTLWRWLQTDEFQNAYRKARREAFSQCVARLQNASNAAVGTLLRVMLDREAPAASRVRAADSVLNHAGKAIELEDLGVRVSELERAAESTKQPRAR